MGVGIAYLTRGQIDTRQWDHCIGEATNGLIYGYSHYLDAMTDNWDALVLNDYAAVMPLPWRKKWTIQYLYYPFLTAQLGVFGCRLNSETLSQFLHAVPRKFRLWDFSLNHGNLFPVPGFDLYQRSNYVLDLRPSYDLLRNNFRENVRRNAKKCLDLGCMQVIDIPLSEVMTLTKLQSPSTPEADLHRFEKIFHQLQQTNQAKTYGIRSPQGQLIASAAFLYSHHRAYYLLVGNHPNGRTLGASHALIDGFIRDHAGREMLLDFEGSDVPSLQFFYTSFGAKAEPYPATRFNNMPWWIRWAKK